MGNKPSTKLHQEDLDYCLRNTHFEQTEIVEWFKSFHKDCPNGYLTLEEFRYIYAQYFPSGDSSSFAEHVFRRFDIDNDQKISFREFLTALSVTAKSSPEEKVKWAFELYDIDKDGFISRDEMIQIVTSIYRMVGSVMSLPDDESTPEKRTNKIFNQFDLDRDGKLSRQEFTQGALSDPSILRLLDGDTRSVTTTTTMIPSARNNSSSITRLRT